MSGAAVLVVEDDEAIGRGLRDALSGNGYEVRWATSASAAQAEVRALAPDLVLVDLGLPDLDGVQLCREVRSATPAAVIVVLTARRDEVDIVLALEAGADDYLTKPFRLRELLARLRAHVRRSAGWPQPNSHIGSLSVHVESRRVFVGETEVELRAREYDLLSALTNRAGRVCTRDQLMNDVWDSSWYSSTKTLDMHISTLRRKLVDAGWTGQVTTIRGVGYRLETE